MKNLISICLFSFASFSVFAQEFDCSKYYEEYCETLNSDSNLLPVYTAGYMYSQKKIDSTIVSIPNCIGNLTAFCEGVKEALEAKYLAIRQVGDPGHVSACSYYSYEKHGVNLVMTGDIIFDNAIFSKNAGFNFIMKKKIKDSIGIEKYKLLGKKEPEWIEITEMNIYEIYETLHLDKLSDTTVHIKLDTSLLKKTKFKQLEGVTFSNVKTNKTLTINEMISGGEFKIGDNKRLYMKFNFENYQNSNFCISSSYSSIIVPITFK